jgi:hypothetical protein
MTAKAFRTVPSSQLFGVVWDGASNEIANSATASIPGDFGKNSRDFSADQTDYDFCCRLRSVGLSWSPETVTLGWDNGQMFGGQPGGGAQVLYMSPAMVFAAELADLGVGNVGIITNAEGGTGISGYAGSAGADAFSHFESRIADAPSEFVMRVLIGAFGRPDMANGTLANAVEANLTTWENRYRNSGVPGAESFLACVFSHHPYFGPGGGDEQPEYPTVVAETAAWAAADPRRRIITTASVTDLRHASVTVPDPTSGPHWETADTVLRVACAARSVVDALAVVAA